MLIKVIGENETADRARALIQVVGVIVEHAPQFTFVIREDTAIEIPVVDGVDSALEGRFVSLLTELTKILPAKGKVLLDRGGGNQDDRVLVITVPADIANRLAVAQAVYRTCVQLHDRGWRATLRRWI